MVEQVGMALVDLEACRRLTGHQKKYMDVRECQGTSWIHPRVSQVDE